MAKFKPAYLVHGDDHGRIAERRARLRAIAEAQSGAAGLELFEDDQARPESVAAALSAMTFALGHRFIVVDGAERWKEGELDELEQAMGQLPPDTTVVFFAREDGRLRAPRRLHEAVRRAGGEISAEEAVKPRELPGWVLAKGRELGLQLDIDAARALVAQVGERQQRLARELEKLALYVGAGARVDPVGIEELAAPSAERRAWSLADALLAGDPAAATGVFLRLRAQGERLSGLIWSMAQRLRTAHEVAVAFEAGQPQREIRRRLRMPSRAADRLIADARRIGSEQLQHWLVEIADLELASRGGGAGGASEDTLALRVISGSDGAGSTARAV